MSTSLIVLLAVIAVVLIAFGLAAIMLIGHLKRFSADLKATNERLGPQLEQLRTQSEHTQAQIARVTASAERLKDRRRH